MKKRDIETEALAETSRGLWRKRDLRHQNQSLLAAGNDCGDRRQIDFGLAAAGDAFDQEGRELPAVGLDGIHGGLLIVIQGGRRHRVRGDRWNRQTAALYPSSRTQAVC